MYEPLPLKDIDESIGKISAHAQRPPAKGKPGKCDSGGKPELAVLCSKEKYSEYDSLGPNRIALAVAVQRDQRAMLLSCQQRAARPSGAKLERLPPKAKVGQLGQGRVVVWHLLW